MARNLDDLLKRSAATPVEGSLDGLEPLVWSRVEIRRSERLASQLRLGAMAMALVTGLTAGGVGAVAAPSPPGELAIFTLDAGLSPLVKLDTVR